MSQKKFRLGMIGAGGIAQAQHLPGWKNIPDVEIVAIADVRLELAQKVAKEFNIQKVFSDFRDLVKLDLDAVDICTPNRVHTPAALAALGSGKHVLCEKPLATSTAEVRKLGQLADKKKLKLMTAQHLRFATPSFAIKSWADAGNLGKVYHARVRAMRSALLPVSPGFIDRKLSGGGPCMDIGVHALDACMWIMGFPKPTRVSGVAKVNFAKGNAIPGLWGEWDRKVFSVEDFAGGFVHFENGATMTVETAWLGHQSENEDLIYQLFGLKGGVRWPSAETTSVQGKNFVHGKLQNSRQIDKPHWEEIKAFYECVVNNTPSPVPWTETIKVIGILEGIYASQKAGKEIRLKI